MPRVELLQDLEPAKIRQYLENRFSLDELYTLAFDLNINYESLPHDATTKFVRALIYHTIHTGQLTDLLRATLELRPDPITVEPIYQRLLKVKEAPRILIPTPTYQSTNNAVGATPQQQTPISKTDTATTQNANNHDSKGSNHNVNKSKDDDANTNTGWKDSSRAVAFPKPHRQTALPRARPVVENKRREAVTLHNMGEIHYEAGENSKALEYYEQALSLRQSIGDKQGEATTLTNMGAVYYDLGDANKALEYYEMALTIGIMVVLDKQWEATTLTNIGVAYYDLGDSSKALEYYKMALPIYKILKNTNGEANILTNIGMAYYDLGENSKALECYQMALPLYRTRTHGAMRMNGEYPPPLYNSASAPASYRHVVQLDEIDANHESMAVEYPKLTSPVSRTAFSGKSGEAILSYSIGKIYYKTGQLEEAVKYLAQCVKLNTQLHAISLASDQSLLAVWQQELANKLKQQQTQVEKE
jgi:tetratricopeptide (TPR) repeat protein